MSKLQDFFQAAHQPTFVPEISSTMAKLFYIVSSKVWVGGEFAFVHVLFSY
jgi:hypothetical protein